MLEAYRLTRKDGAPGIDGVMAVDYETNLEGNLRDLLGRIKSGRYNAPPVRRAYIPKADGSQRMLGIPWPDPCVGTVPEREEHGSASHRQGSICPCGGRGE